MSRYLEHDKLHEVQAETQAVGEFLDWLEYEHGEQTPSKISHNETFRRKFGLGVWVSEFEFAPYPGDIQNLLAEWKGIDRKKLEAEKRQMLAELRAAQQPPTPTTGATGGVQ